MIPLSNDPSPLPPDPMPQAPQRPPRRFRWEVLGIIATVLGFLWFVNGIEPAFKFEDLMRGLGVRHQDRYVRLVVLGLVAVFIVLIYKIYKRSQQEKK